MDAIVITRGGGSIADLSCFDSQIIAEGIAACRLPVFSGIGHEINITITDLAAHTYQKTPTAIAQFLTGLVKSFLISLEERVVAVVDGTKEKLKSENNRLKNCALDVQNGTTGFLKQHHLLLAARQEQLKERPLTLLNKALVKVEAGQDSLVKDLRVRFKAEDEKLKNFNRLLELASPLNTLKRGFSITRLSDGTLVRSTKQAKPGSKILTEVSDGQLKATVEGGGK